MHDLVTPIAKRKLETTEHEILHDIFLSKKKKNHNFSSHGQNLQLVSIR